MGSFWIKFKKWMGKLYRKAVMDKGTPEYIAKGWSLGVFIGLLIPFGFQLMLSIPLSFLLKCSKIGATAGTFVTNHLTIFLIYPLQCYLGNKIIGGKLTFSYLEDQLGEVILRQEYKVLLDLGWEIVISFFAGGLLLAVICAPVSYFLVKNLVIRYRALRERRRAAKAAKAAAKAAKAAEAAEAEKAAKAEAAAKAEEAAK